MKKNKSKFLKAMLSYANSDIHYASIVIYVFFAVIAGVFSFNIFGIRAFTNISNSMNPSINTGSVILVKAFPEYNPGDIISYYVKTANEEQIVTHRIVQIGGNTYVTKGDANQVSDREVVRPRLVIGKVIVIIPELGYLITFAKSKIGIFLLWILPATFLICLELLKIADLYGIIPKKSKS